ncbi:MAG TPA: LLM class flavin-dependent oxidoreductase [Candidatus Angelobacter sp.]|jgi:alkanesulfonate monooxygenase|nr:LLM class flavin-dependent oxidoreductase [Candidatus Angelobacter sp.]
MGLRFHWSLSSAGEKFRGAQSRNTQSGLPNLKALVEFCQHAEECGIESLLTAFGFHRPDPMVLASAVGMATEKIKFMVAVRSGIFSPTVFVQQVNTVSAFINGRICLNVVAGHTPAEQRSYGDFLDHDHRYRRTDEFLTVCHSLWQNGPVNFEGQYYRIENGKLNTPFVCGERSRPEIYLGGNSALAEELAIKHADCLWRLPDVPEALKPRIRVLRAKGVEVGLLVSVIARSTHEEAVQAASSIIAGLGEKPRNTHKEFARRSDSVAFTSVLEKAETGVSEWLTPYLWTGAVPYLGAPSIALVGSAEEVASAMMEYQRIGVSQFLLMGWPDLEEMTFFNQVVLPLIRAKEQKERQAAIQPFFQPETSLHASVQETGNEEHAHKN